MNFELEYENYLGRDCNVFNMLCRDGLFWAGSVLKEYCFTAGGNLEQFWRAIISIFWLVYRRVFENLSIVLNSFLSSASCDHMELDFERDSL